MVPLFWALRSMRRSNSFPAARIDLPAAILHKAAAGRGPAVGHRVAMATNGSKEQLFAEVSSVLHGADQPDRACPTKPIRRFAASSSRTYCWRSGWRCPTFAARPRSRPSPPRSPRSDASPTSPSGRASRGRSSFRPTSSRPRRAPDEVGAAQRPENGSWWNRSSSCRSPSARRSCFASKGFSYGEMATILGISPNAVMLRCQRAKSTLKTIMERRS